ncbi:hypothetical protein AgCh_003284 [Apium graveolens]
MTTPMAISKSFKLFKNIPIRSLIKLHLNPIATVNSTQTLSESQLKLRRFESLNPNSSLKNDVVDVFRNQMRGEMAAVMARGRAVKIDDEFNEEDVEDDSDEFESEEDDEFDEMDGEDCLDDDDDEDEDPVYKKRK